MTKLLLFPTILLSCFMINAQGLEVNEIIAKHAEAIGGKDKWKNLRTYEMTYQREAEDGTYTTTATMKRPDKYRLDFKRVNWHFVKSFDGKQGWYSENGAISDMRPGEEIEMAEEGSYYEELALSQSLGFKAELLGKEILDEREVFKLQLTKSEKDVQYYYVDTETFLINMTSEFSEDKAYEDIEFKTIMLDYRNIAGYLFPFNMLLYSNDTLFRTYVVQEVILNVEIEDSFFERPQ